MKQYQLRDGIFEAIIDRYYKDPPWWLMVRKTAIGAALLPFTVV
jgi:hypothetical protein